MAARIVTVKIPRSPGRYEIKVGHRLLDDCGSWAKRCIGGRAGRLAIISNPTVFQLYGNPVRDRLADAGFDVAVHLIGDGERYKNLRTLEKTLAFLGEHRFTRTDAIIALGGGVVGDLAGFAAAVYLRGIAFLQMPTTLLSMIDSSVGGKTGVNSAFGKNLIGAFYQPAGVLIDASVLRTLPRRELTAGFCEAVKQGTISGKRLFRQTADFLAKYSPKDIADDDPEVHNQVADLIAAQIAFKARIVEGDERESTRKTGSTSRKILNFGHTMGHALEKVTKYRKLKHGEAVGYGMMFAGSLSNKLELLDKDTVKLLNDVVRSAGTLPALNGIDSADIVDALVYDKKLVNDSLQWVLLKGIGKPVIAPHSAIPHAVLLETIRETIQK